jgi:CheY-like chemotaxis protein
MNATAILPIDEIEPASSTVVDRSDAPILVVDDSIVSQRLAGGLIQQGTGRPVVYAKNGLEALTLLETLEPSVVLTDLHMPVMDGLELVEAIRARHPGIPVVLMTAFGSEAIAMRALKAGAANYVPKDCLVTDLVETLQNLLTVVDGNRRRRQLLSFQTGRTSSFEITNDPDLFPAIVTLVQEELHCFSIGDETARLRVAVALQESLANALFHGNLECSSDLRQVDERDFYRLADRRRAMEPYRSRRIHLESTVSRDEIRIHIRDEGPGFDVSKLDKPFDPEDLMRVGGRGMILIRTFLDEVIHNSKGNHVTLIKYK